MVAEEQLMRLVEPETPAQTASRNSKAEARRAAVVS